MMAGVALLVPILGMPVAPGARWRARVADGPLPGRRP
jgi:hypothetical protein